jgi:hypothetical protein
MTAGTHRARIGRPAIRFIETVDDGPPILGFAIFVVLEVLGGPLDGRRLETNWVLSADAAAIVAQILRDYTPSEPLECDLIIHADGSIAIEWRNLLGSIAGGAGQCLTA